MAMRIKNKSPKMWTINIVGRCLEQNNADNIIQNNLYSVKLFNDSWR